MSEIQRRGRQALHELEIHREKHDAYRAEALEDAVKLAAFGEADGAYRKLLLVVALDGLRTLVHAEADNAEIESEADRLRELT